MPHVPSRNEGANNLRSPENPNQYASCANNVHQPAHGITVLAPVQLVEAPKVPVRFVRRRGMASLPCLSKVKISEREVVDEVRRENYQGGPGDPLKLLNATASTRFINNTLRA